MMNSLTYARSAQGARGTARPLNNALAASLLLAVSGALAQTPPDPISALRRDTDQAERALRSRAIDIPDAPAAETATSVPDGVKFTLRSIVFSPSEILSAEALTALAQPLIGQSVSMTQLRSLVAQVNALYQQKGVSTAEALLPPQELQDGEVRVLLVEGRLGNVELKGQASLSSAYVLGRLKVPEGQLADTTALSRSVRRFNATNDAQVNLTLRPGSEFGRTDVLVDLQEQPRNQLRLLLDNYGHPQTGAQQVTTSYRRLSSVIEGDRLDVYAINTKAILTGRVAYDVPVGSDGLRVGVSTSRNRISYNLPSASSEPGPSFVANAHTESLDIAYPLLLTDRQLIRVLSSLNQSESTQETAGYAQVSSHVVHENIALQGDLEADGWRASWTLGQTWLQWKSMSGNVSPQSERYTDAGLTLLASVTPNAYVRLNVNARAASSGVAQLPSERYLLGGVSTLRGYAAGSLYGTGGNTTSVELHREWQFSSESIKNTQTLDAFVFVDQGRVTGSANALSAAWSTGLGVNWTLPGGLRLQAFGAHVGTPSLAKNVSNVGLQVSFSHNL